MNQRHTCERLGCMVLVGDGQLACDEHWRELPLVIRDAMWQALRNFGQFSTQYGDAIAVAVSRLRNPVRR